MEPECSYVAKCTENSNSALHWFLHDTQSQALECVDDFCVGRDKFWEGQWSPNTKELADFNKQAHLMDQNPVQSCDSPLASDSSSSLSTWESSFFSWNSENSYTAGRHALQSPEVLSSRFSGFSLFNSGINHLEAVCKEETLNVKLGQGTFDANSECSRCVNLEFCNAELSQERSDDGWVSDSDDSESWVSTLSQEITKKGLLKKSNGMHLGRHSHNLNTLDLGESRACGLDAVHLANKEIDADASIHPNFTSAEKRCCAAPHQPCRVIYAAETHQMHVVQDFQPVVHNSEIEIVSEWHAPDERIKGNGMHVRCELPGIEISERKSSEIPQGDSGHDDRKMDLCTHQLPHLANSVVPKSLQSVDMTRPRAHTKPMYSAAVKERFALSTLHGCLRFAEQNGSPCYSFFVDDSDEVLFARVCRQERQSNKENCDWTYTFHSKRDIGKAKGHAWKGWPKKQRLASDLIANMTVPDVCRSKKMQCGHSKEACFVLYDGGGQQHWESSTINDEKPQCQPLKAEFPNMVTSRAGYIQPSVRRHIVDSSASKGSCPNGSASNNTSKNGPCHLVSVKNAAGPNNLCTERLNSTCVNQQAELAAIVISTSVKEKKMARRKECKAPLKDGAGWGVKFLDDGLESGWGMSFTKKSSRDTAGLEELHSCMIPKSGGGQVECVEDQNTRGACQNYAAQLQTNIDSRIGCCFDLTQKPEKRLSSRRNRLKVDVTVILPAGDHGLPTDDEEDVGGGVGHLHGPTPLLDRWVSGGECECGGWDMGCGLSVFKAEPLSLHNRTSNIALTRHDRMNWLSPGNPLKVFTQGYKQKKVLVLEMIEAGLFSLSFHARFSPLQAFATAVALFHQQMTHKS